MGSVDVIGRNYEEGATKKKKNKKEKEQEKEEKDKDKDKTRTTGDEQQKNENKLWCESTTNPIPVLRIAASRGFS